MSQKVFKLYLQRLTAQDRKTIIVQTQTNQHELHKDYIALTVEFAGPAARAMIFFGRWASSRSQASGAIWKAWEPILEAASLLQFVAFVLNVTYFKASEEALPTNSSPSASFPSCSISCYPSSAGMGVIWFWKWLPRSCQINFRVVLENGPVHMSWPSEGGAAGL